MEVDERCERSRRPPEVARREILVAANRALSESRFREMTVESVMARTGLSRPSFYVYFADRHALLLELWEVAVARLREAEGILPRDRVGPAGVRPAVAAFVEAFEGLAHIFCAVAEGAASDARLERAYLSLLREAAERVAAAIDSDELGGVGTRREAQGLTWPLVLMTERYLVRTFADRRAAICGTAVDYEPLVTIWVRTLYGVDPPPMRLL